MHPKPSQDFRLPPLASIVRARHQAMKSAAEEAPESTEAQPDAPPQRHSGFLSNASFGIAIAARPEAASFSDLFLPIFVDEIEAYLVLKPPSQNQLHPFNRDLFLRAGGIAKAAEYAELIVGNKGFATCEDDQEIWGLVLAGCRLAHAIDSDKNSGRFSEIQAAALLPDGLNNGASAATRLRYHTLADLAASFAERVGSDKECSDIRIFRAFQQFRLANYKNELHFPAQAVIAHYLFGAGNIVEVLERHSQHYSTESQYALFRFALKGYSFAARTALESPSSAANPPWISRSAVDEAERLFGKQLNRFSQQMHFADIADEVALFARLSVVFHDLPRALNWCDKLLHLIAVQSDPEEVLDRHLPPIMQAINKIATAKSEQESGNYQAALRIYRDLLSLNGSTDESVNLQLRRQIGQCLPIDIAAISTDELCGLHGTRMEFAAGSVELQLGNYQGARVHYGAALQTLVSEISQSGYTFDRVAAINCMMRGIDALFRLDITPDLNERNGSAQSKTDQLWLIADELSRIPGCLRENDRLEVGLKVYDLELATLKQIGNCINGSDTATISKVSKHLTANHKARGEFTKRMKNETTSAEQVPT